MRVELRPGAELDLLTQDELRAVLRETLSGYLRPPEVVRGSAGVDLDGSGNASHAEMYKPDAGMEFALTRLVVVFDSTYTPGNPYTNSAGWLQIERGGLLEEFVAFAGGLPAVYTENLSKAIRWRDQEACTVSVTDGPASAGLLLRFQGFLYPITQPLL